MTSGFVEIKSRDWFRRKTATAPLNKDLFSSAGQQDVDQANYSSHSGLTLPAHSKRLSAKPNLGDTGRNLRMTPEVRDFADPFEGLEAQLARLRGLNQIVPPLIEADRRTRWEEIQSRPSNGEDGDTIDVYGDESGPGEEGGFADYERTIRESAVVFAWAVFHDFLVHELKRTCLNFDLSEHPALQTLVEEDLRRWDRRFDQAKKRYRDFAGINLSQLDSWQQVLHTQELRNALVHNQGLYTRAYLDLPLAYRPSEEDLLGFTPPKDDQRLIDNERIPLSLDFTDTVIVSLNAAAEEIRNATRTSTDA